MNTRSLIAAIVALAGLGLCAMTAHAQMVAGWDHSQYAGPDLLSIDGATFTNTLDANYSSLDPTFNAGAESAAFGTLYLDGQFGSSAVDPNPGSATYVPVPPSLASNLTAPVTGPGTNPFDSLTILTSEGQAFANLQGMTAKAPVSVVYGASLSSVSQVGRDWVLSFGARTASGSSTISVEFSVDGGSYSPAGSVDIDGGCVVIGDLLDNQTGSLSGGKPAIATRKACRSSPHRTPPASTVNTATRACTSSARRRWPTTCKSPRRTKQWNEATVSNRC